MLVRRFAVVFLLITACTLPLVAAASPSSVLAEKGSLTITFGPGSQAKSAAGLFSDGSIYTKDRGFGWDQDLTRQARNRGDGCMGVSILDRDVSLATFSVDLPDGNYLFEAAASDSQYAGGIAVQIDGEFIAAPMPFSVGQRVTMTAPVTSSGGRASIAIVGGREAIGNCLLNSIRITPASADPDKWHAVKSATDAYRKRISDAKATKLAKREKQRAAYKPVTISDQRLPRQTIDLSGSWLFQPIKDATTTLARDPNSSDSSWHTMRVPEFWKPIEWWIYMSGPNTSHNFLRNEVERCQELTFDYATTNSGWYRQWIEIPASMRGRRLVLHFDAVASVAQVYWNGKEVGSHIGMFGPFECEVTPNVRFGEKNLLTVMVSSGRTETAQASGASAVAVTVDVTPEMLNSLAHGWYKPGMAGIWQPVTLVVSGKSRIADVYFRPRTNGAKIEATISQPLLGRDLQSRPGKSTLSVKNTILDAVTGKTLYTDSKGVSVSKGMAVADTGKLAPKLWSPEHPNMYVLKTKLISGGEVVDEVTTKVGFKTFEARGNRLYLNGKPYFLRGADMPPHGLRPNDKALAEKFMKGMHDGNTMATRFHIAPPSQIWLDAADKFGVGSSVGENWPWVLMGDTPIPDKKLIALWQKDFIEVVRANRNHPSMFIWTISNESYFEGDKDMARRVEKYRIFSDLIKAVRKEDPQTPIVFHSGHVHTKAQEPMLAENRFDDGDIDDPHFYFGWYQASPFHIDVAKQIEPRGTGTRPMISQEASTGYPDNDTGHPVESYIRNHTVPQVWVGEHALYSARPDMFLDTHAQITKEYAEKIRRQRTWLSGWMLFANCCWFKDVYDAETITPYPTYWAVRTAHQPVLVSLDSPNRHFVAGQKFTSDVYVINDDPDRPKAADLTLVWHVRTQSNDELSGTAKMPDCAYDGKSHARVEFEMPANLPVDSINATLKIELRSGDTVISRNEYPLICVPEKWQRANASKPFVVLESYGTVCRYLRDAGFTCHSEQSIDWKKLAAGDVVVVGSGAGIGSKQDFADFVRGGGRVLMLSPRSDNPVLAAIPDFPADQVKTVDTSGDFADVFAHELLDGMDPMNMHWWNAEPGDLVRVCRFGYQLPDTDGVTMLAKHIQPHAYIKPTDLPGLTSLPAFEVKRGSGRVIVSSFLLADDPIARRFAINLIDYLAR